MEAVTPDFPFGQILVRQPVNIGARRQREMEGRVEYSYVRCRRHMFARRPVCLEIIRVVQRSEDAEFVDLLFHFCVDDYGLVKLVSSVDDAMPDGFHIDAAELIEHGFDRVGHAGDTLDLAFCKRLFGVRIGFEQVELERRTAGIQDQYFHWKALTGAHKLKPVPPLANGF